MGDNRRSESRLRSRERLDTRVPRPTLDKLRVTSRSLSKRTFTRTEPKIIRSWRYRKNHCHFESRKRRFFFEPFQVRPAMILDSLNHMVMLVKINLFFLRFNAFKDQYCLKRKFLVQRSFPRIFRSIFRPQSLSEIHRFREQLFRIVRRELEASVIKSWIRSR